MKLSPLYHHCSDHLSDRPQIPPRRAESLQWRHRSATWAMASWRRVQDKTWLKHGWNMVETWLKHGWNMVETWLNHGWNMVETWLKHGWNMVETWLKPILRMSGVRDVFSSREKSPKKTDTCLFQSGGNFCFLPNKYVLHKNDLFGQTRVSSAILLPSPFFSGKIARPSGENTRPRGLTISHSGIYFQERRFSARTATILVFLSRYLWNVLVLQDISAENSRARFGWKLPDQKVQVAIAPTVQVGIFHQNPMPYWITSRILLKTTSIIRNYDLWSGIQYP